jgi:uncharacterized protein YjbI with pentapeptide repeats
MGRLNLKATLMLLLAIFLAVPVAVILVETIRLRNTGFEAKSLWDWLDLLIIPLTLLIGGYFLNRQERLREQKLIESNQRVERELALDKQREANLQSYLDRITELMLTHDLREKEKKEAQHVARVRTLTILLALDGNRQRLVLHFLKEAELLGDYKASTPISALLDLQEIDLSNAELRELNLPGVFLVKANFSGANLHNATFSYSWLTETNFQNADLSNASLTKTNIFNCDFTHANLQNANLQSAWAKKAVFCNASLQDADLGAWFDTHRYLWADSQGAFLHEANLSGANLEGCCLVMSDLAYANLKNANLRFADLRSANLMHSDLTNADLTGAILSRARLGSTTVTLNQLSRAKSLVDAEIDHHVMNELRNTHPQLFEAHELSSAESIVKYKEETDKHRQQSVL